MWLTRLLAPLGAVALTAVPSAAQTLMAADLLLNDDAVQVTSTPGLSNREIGKSLSISVETVKEHVQNILRKLQVNDRTQAAVWAVKRGLV